MQLIHFQLVTTYSKVFWFMYHNFLTKFQVAYRLLIIILIYQCLKYYVYWKLVHNFFTEVWVALQVAKKRRLIQWKWGLDKRKLASLIQAFEKGVGVKSRDIQAFELAFSKIKRGTHGRISKSCLVEVRAIQRKSLLFFSVFLLVCFFWLYLHDRTTRQNDTTERHDRTTRL